MEGLKQVMRPNMWSKILTTKQQTNHHYKQHILMRRIQLIRLVELSIVVIKMILARYPKYYIHFFFFFHRTTLHHFTFKPALYYLTIQVITVTLTHSSLHLAHFTLHIWEEMTLMWYPRLTFHDDVSIKPRWSVDDETQHRKDSYCHYFRYSHQQKAVILLHKGNVKGKI